MAEPLSKEEREEIRSWAEAVVANPVLTDFHKAEAHDALRLLDDRQAAEERAERFRVALEEAIGLAESGWFRSDRFQSEARRELERLRALAADQTGGE